MQDLIAISPVLGSFGSQTGHALAVTGLPKSQRTPRQFGNRFKARYANGMSQSTLTWTSEDRAGVPVLSPNGQVDEATADDFKQQLLNAVEAGPASVVLDLDGVAYMSSRGLRALTLAQRAGQASDTTIVLARPNETMQEILAISRYDMVFRVADTIEDAIGN